jgi:hypothetical protein
MPFFALPAVFAATVATNAGLAVRDRTLEAASAWSQPVPPLVDEAPAPRGVGGLVRKFLTHVEQGDRRGFEIVCDRFLGCLPGMAFTQAWRGHLPDVRSPHPVSFEAAGVLFESFLIADRGSGARLAFEPLIFASGLGLGVETTF